ncbi:MAG TPA: phosphatidylglycerol lysyltransferase domain-containing protein [Mycobacteriales bacterium]|nr:phosphatidylglycerol lysyltransferase domain-containing protein [Mycobacteriales bacterium]
MFGRTKPTAPNTPAEREVRTVPAYPEQLSWAGIGIALVGVVLALHGSHIRDHEQIAEGLALAVVGRGLALGRPPVIRHLLVALGLLVLARLTGDRGDHAVAQLMLIGAALAALWASPSPPSTADQRRRIVDLVDQTPNDCLAPFAQRLDKSYIFSPDGQAAIAYRVRLGVAVASGDPVGPAASQQAAAEAYLATANANGWRMGILGAGEDWSGWWREQGLRALPIGRDVVIDPETFSLSGRAFRNLRQAVQRTHNFGVTTEIYDETELPADLRATLLGLVQNSKRNQNRGFSMILDGLLQQQHVGTKIVVAFDTDRRVVGFQRFATADRGREISQDLPWRVPGAPNGVDERLAFDMIEWAKAHGARRVSLCFAAFPELFDAKPERGLDRMGYWAAHRLDPMIRLESLYRYLRKFHALGKQRYVMLRLREALPIAVAMLTLEFGASRTRRRERRGWRRLARRADSPSS